MVKTNPMILFDFRKLQFWTSQVPQKAVPPLRTPKTHLSMTLNDATYVRHKCIDELSICNALLSVTRKTFYRRRNILWPSFRLPTFELYKRKILALPSYREETSYQAHQYGARRRAPGSRESSSSYPARAPRGSFLVPPLVSTSLGWVLGQQNQQQVLNDRAFKAW